MTKRDAMRDLGICNDATPGPWKCHHDDGDWGAGVISEETDDVVAITKQLQLGSQFIRDAVFIAVAREALPYYIQRVQELEIEAGRLKYQQIEDIELMSETVEVQELAEKTIEKVAGERDAALAEVAELRKLLGW